MTDRLFGLTAGILSLLFLFVAVPSISGSWQSGADARYFTVGPRLFPYIAGALTLLFSVLIAIKPAPQSRFDLLRTAAIRNNVLRALALSLGYVVLLNLLGFTLASVLALGAFLIGFGERRWYLVLPIAVLCPAIVRLVFLEGFSLELPVGYLDFGF